MARIRINAKARTKSYQVVISPGAHKTIKERARQCDMTIGAFIENLLSSLEFRIRRMIEDLHADGLCDQLPFTSDKTINQLYAAVLLCDKEGLGPADSLQLVKKALADLKAAEVPDDFVPRIRGRKGAIYDRV
jgi:hypothetical protein